MRFSVALFLLAWLMPLGISAQPTSEAKSPEKFIVIFSSRMLTEVHENDAKAAVKAWSEALARERGIEVEHDPQVLDGAPAIRHAIQSGQAHVVTMTTDEYLSLAIDSEPLRVLASTIDGKVTEEYLLLTHKDAAIESFQGLEGRKLLMYENSRTSMALHWLDTYLMQEGLPPATHYFGRVDRLARLSAVILPVFFGQADACLVTRRGMEIMSELNPQIGRQLQILAYSPNVLPSLALVLPSCAELLEEDDFVYMMSHLQKNPSGRQILELFQTEEFSEVPPSSLDGARQLLARHGRLMAEWENRTGSGTHPTAGVEADVGNPAVGVQ